MMVKAKEKIKPGKGTGVSWGQGGVCWVLAMVMGRVGIENLDFQSYTYHEGDIWVKMWEEQREWTTQISGGKHFDW